MKTEYQDPREAPSFIREHYPTADGQAAPPSDSASRDDVIRLEFLAAYYQLNCEYARLLEVRRSFPSPERDEKEREQLQAVEQALIARDRLEDLYAAYGIIVEPTVQSGFTRDLRFTFGASESGQRRGAEALLIEAILPISSKFNLALDDVPLRVHVVRDQTQPGEPPRRLATAIPGTLPDCGQSLTDAADADDSAVPPTNGRRQAPPG